MRPVQLESSGSQDAPTPHDDFEDVFRSHHERLVRLAGLLCGNAPMAEDAVAEVFARLCPRWQPGMIEDVDAYLRRAVVNEICGEFRRRARRKGRTIPPTVTTATSTEDAVTERDRMWKAVLRLPPPQRAVLVLRYFDDGSEARVAEILEMPIGTVKSTTARGLDGLRRILEGNDDGD